MAMGGGMAVLPSTAEAWKKVTGTIIIEGYGLSETSPVATANPLQRLSLAARLVSHYH